MIQRSSFADLRLAYRPARPVRQPPRARLRAGRRRRRLLRVGRRAFRLLLRLRGRSWDSTVLHFPTELVVYLLDAALPALAAAYVVTRTFHFPFLVTPADAPADTGDGYGRDDDSDDESRDTTPAASSRSTWRKAAAAAATSARPPTATATTTTARRRRRACRRRRRPGGGGGDGGGGGSGAAAGRGWAPMSTLCSRGVAVVVEYLRCLCLGHAPVYSDLAMIYLIKVYVLGLATLSLLGLACLQAHSYTFVLPQLHLVRFELEEEWTRRFQLLTLHLITLALLGVSTAGMLLWPSPDLSSAYYDKLYSLVLLKSSGGAARPPRATTSSRCSTRRRRRSCRRASSPPSTTGRTRPYRTTRRARGLAHGGTQIRQRVRRVPRNVGRSPCGRLVAVAVVAPHPRGQARQECVMTRVMRCGTRFMHLLVTSAWRETTETSNREHVASKLRRRP